MIFNTRKNLELADNYVGGRRDFEVKSDKNEYVNVMDETYGCWSDCFIVEWNVRSPTLASPLTILPAYSKLRNCPASVHF